MIEINNIQYYTDREVMELYDVSKWSVLELKNKKIIKDTPKIILGPNGQIGYVYNKIEVDKYVHHYKNIMYRKNYFSGKLEIIDDNTLLFDGEIFKRSPTYNSDNYVNRNGTKIYRKTNDGYLKIGITKRGDNVCHAIITAKNGDSQRTIFVHKLQIYAWVGPPQREDHIIVRHLNDIPGDNRLENLAWGTQQENRIDNLKNYIKYKHFMAYMRLHNNAEYEKFCTYHEKFTSQQDLYSDINDMTWQLTMDAEQYALWKKDVNIKRTLTK